MSQLLIDIPEPAIQPAENKNYPNSYAAIPPNGRTCSHTGLKHAQLYKLLTKDGLARPFVRVVNIKKPGAAKGKTLFHVGDMMRYLDRLANEQGTGELRLDQ